MGAEFLKLYAPRIINVLGSPAINAAQGTETLGVAEGGMKITLYNMNGIDLGNMAWLNQYIFHVMHHEFSHILHQTKTFPGEYELISAGKYDSQSWQYHSDEEAYSLGFVTPYSMSEAHEDFVEVISSYITDTRQRWQDRGITMAEDHTHIVEWDEDQEGTDIIINKINMCKDWLLEKFDYELDSLRAEVQRRQDALTYDIVMNDAYDK
jgi:substrate import-associated zinc metallohydrolase lipoprotein